MRVLKGVEGATEEGGAEVMVRVYGDEVEECWRDWVGVSVRVELLRCLKGDVSLDDIEANEDVFDHDGRSEYKPKPGYGNIAQVNSMMLRLILLFRTLGAM